MEVNQHTDPGGIPGITGGIPGIIGGTPGTTVGTPADENKFNHVKSEITTNLELLEIRTCYATLL